MSAFFATSYTIHFDDTMAYGSHHFLTGFKFQCASREAFLFGERVYDIPGVKQALEQIHLLTHDAYSRNLNAATLGDRIAILLTLEEWGKASARFCYRAVDAAGRRICAGFQMLVCADATTGSPIELPASLRDAMEQLREIEEPRQGPSFRERVLTGGRALDEVFGDDVCRMATDFLNARYPAPQVITADLDSIASRPTDSDSISSLSLDRSDSRSTVSPPELQEAWMFVGQAGFDADWLYRLGRQCLAQQWVPAADLEAACRVVDQTLDRPLGAALLGSVDEMRRVAEEVPAWTQFAIHLQNLLGAAGRFQRLGVPPLWRQEVALPAPAGLVLVGHSFGEIAAFTAAGCLTWVDSFRAVGSRVQAIARFAPADGGMLAVLAARDQVMVELSMLPAHEMVIAGRNHPAQTVVAGPLDQLREFKSHLRLLGIAAVDVTSPTGFHHPSLVAAAQHWLTTLRSLAWQTPRCRVFTPNGRREVSANSDPAQILAGQLTTPFDFYGALQDIAHGGINRFIDCGSTGLIASLARRSAAEHWQVLTNDVVDAMATDAPLLEAVQVTDVDGDTVKPDTDATDRSLVIPDPQTIGITAMGCLLPAGVSGAEALWQCLAEQRLGIVDMRQYDQQWENDFYSATLIPDRSTSPLFGRVRDEDLVAPAAISAEWFDTLTRTQKLLTIALAPCCEGTKNATRISILIGATADGFEDLDWHRSLAYAAGDWPLADQPAGGDAVALSVVSPQYRAVRQVTDVLFGSDCQVVLVDAACASSLYTVSLGMNLLESDRADAVVAGGVFCPGPGNSCLFSQFKGMTSTGCRPFDRDADGVVFSEGAAFLTLRRGDQIEQHGLPLHGKLLAAGLSSDGRSSSANVPQSDGQLLSLQRAYQRYRVDPNTISAIEGHGTSTPVGDSTEVETLHRFYADRRSLPLPLHSLKGTLGHAGWAAGTASLIAACMYLKKRQFPAQAFFQTASDSLDRSQQAIHVLRQPLDLMGDRLRIAVDGFGFGGANAHLVVESAEAIDDRSSRDTPRSQPPRMDNFVVVAWQQVTPQRSADSDRGEPFAEAREDFQRQYVVLPQLLDDMDTSQMLAVLLAKRTLDQLADVDAALRETTSVVLAMTDKTARGVEATYRVLYPRLQRETDGLQQENLVNTYHQARPSGPYTLQCMMPNVASGRAALMLHLNGPNFVVDAGTQTLASALDCAELLLQAGSEGGTQLVLLEAIRTERVSQGGANPHACQQGDPCAVAYAITTRSLAESKGWQTLATSDELKRQLQASAANSLADQVAVIQRCLNPASNTPAAPSIPIYHPVWVTRPAKHRCLPISESLPTTTAVILPADRRLLVDVLADRLFKPSDWQAPSAMVIVVGAGAERLAADFVDQGVVGIEPQRLQQSDSLLSRLQQWQPQTLLAIQRPDSWQLEDVVSECSQATSLMEFLFLATQRLAVSIEQGRTAVGYLMIDGFRETVHPGSGAIVGFLKSVAREYPRAVCRTVVTRGLSVAAAIERLFEQFNCSEPEWEVLYDGETRHVRRLITSSGLCAKAPLVSLDSSSVVLATGGAKGVTAVMLETLAREYQCTIVAVGRSLMEDGPQDVEAAEQEFYRNGLKAESGVTLLQLKQRFERLRSAWEAADTVQRLRQLGSRVEYLPADVTDSDAVESLVADVVTKYGRVDLVLHGAGVQVSKRLPDRTLSDFRRTYTTKVCGLAYLFRSLRQHLGHDVPFHALTSAFSIMGNDGQHDYGAANETLDRLCDLANVQDHQPWSSIAWLAWDGVGMTRGSEYRALAKQRGLFGLTPELGGEVFSAVIKGETAGAVNVPLTTAEHVEYQLSTVPLQRAWCAGDRIWEFPIEVGALPYLAEHRVGGVATVPGAWIVGLFVQYGWIALESNSMPRSVIVENIQFQRFIKCPDDRDQGLRVVVVQTATGFDLLLLMNVLHSSGRVLLADVTCARAELRFSSDVAQVVSAALPLPNESLPDTLHELTGDPYCRAGQPVLLSGPFDRLHSIGLGRRQRTAVWQRQAGLDAVFPIAAFELDAAWRLGAMDPEGRLYVPTGIERLILQLQSEESRSDTMDWTIRSMTPTVQGDTARWSQTDVIDASGRLQIQVWGATAKRMDRF